MSRDRGSNKPGERPKMSHGPRHSSPHVLNNSPVSPNVAPIPTLSAVPAPQQRLFAATIPTAVAVQWGSGALPLVTVPIQMAIPSVIEAQAGSQGQDSSHANDPPEKNRGRLSSEPGKKDHYRQKRNSGHSDSSHTSRPDNRQGKQHNQGRGRGQDQGSSRSQERREPGDNREGRVETSERGGLSRSHGHGGHGRESKHGERGALLLDDRDPTFSDIGSVHRDRWKRDETVDHVDRSRDRGSSRESERSRDRSRDSNVNRDRGNRWEDKGDSRHEGAVLRDDRDDRPILRENSKPILRENSKPILRENNKPILRENSKPILRENNKPILRENNKPILRENNKPILRENNKPILRENNKPILREDRGDNMSASSSHRGGARLIEDFDDTRDREHRSRSGGREKDREDFKNYTDDRRDSGGRDRDRDRYPESDGWDRRRDSQDDRDYDRHEKERYSGRDYRDTVSDRDDDRRGDSRVYESDKGDYRDRNISRESREYDKERNRSRDHRDSDYDRDNYRERDKGYSDRDRDEFRERNSDRDYRDTDHNTVDNRERDRKGYYRDTDCDRGDSRERDRNRDYRDTECDNRERDRKGDYRDTERNNRERDGKGDYRIIDRDRGDSRERDRKRDYRDTNRDRVDSRERDRKGDYRDTDHDRVDSRERDRKGDYRDSDRGRVDNRERDRKGDYRDTDRDRGDSRERDRKRDYRDSDRDRVDSRERDRRGDYREVNDRGDNKERDRRGDYRDVNDRGDNRERDRRGDYRDTDGNRGDDRERDIKRDYRDIDRDRGDNRERDRKRDYRDTDCDRVDNRERDRKGDYRDTDCDRVDNRERDRKGDYRDTDCDRVDNRERDRKGDYREVNDRGDNRDRDRKRDYRDTDRDSFREGHSTRDYRETDRDGYRERDSNRDYRDVEHDREEHRERDINRDNRDADYNRYDDRERNRSRDYRVTDSERDGYRDRSSTRNVRDNERNDRDSSRDLRDRDTRDSRDRRDSRDWESGDYREKDYRDDDRIDDIEEGEWRESRESSRDDRRHGSVYSERSDRGRKDEHFEELRSGDGARRESDKAVFDKRPRNKDQDNISTRRGPVATGRTGALLIEDRNDDERLPASVDHKRPIVKEAVGKKSDVRRTGAILLEDRVEKPAGPSHTHSSHTHSSHTHSSHTHSSHTHSSPPASDVRGRGKQSDYKDSERESSYRVRSRQRSEDRFPRSQGQKRSWCSSKDEWRGDTAMSDRGSLCEDTYSDLDCWPDSGADRWSDRGSVDTDIEQEYKRIRIHEPSEEIDGHCIRSGTQSGLGDGKGEEALPAWVRSSPADLYFQKDQATGNLVTTKRMQELERRFEHDLVQRNTRAREAMGPYEPPKRPEPKWQHHHQCQGSHHDHDAASCSSSSSDSDSDSDSEEWWIEELKRKEQHPHRLHKELWHNEKGELNYGPLCRCSLKAQKTGIRHDKYPGEQPAAGCNMNSNNLNKLYHYKITVSPVTNFLTKRPTIINFDGHEYMFEGFSVFTHKKIPPLPECQVIRFYIVYTIHIIEEPPPENFSIRSLDLFTQYLFDEILELFDIDWKGPGGDDDCRLYHVMPRFARPFPENGKEIMSMNDVLLYLLKAAKPLVSPRELPELLKLDSDAWQKYVDSFRYMVVTCPGKRPSSLRIDQLDKQECAEKDGSQYPIIVHHGLRPAQLSYAGDPLYKKKWREFMKFKHLLWSRTKVSTKDKEKLEEFEYELQNIRLKCTMKREITVDISSEGFLLTGIRADICQHAMLLPILFGHIRFHECLLEMERSINYQFKDKSLLQLALTHSSYKVNHGTNPDHGRNSLSNCGSRQLEFGDYKIHIKHTRKRGLNVLLRIMSKMAKKSEERSEIPHNERLEFLGDAVVEFITSTHLFYMFPYADEGELTAYRGCLVQNAQLAVLANKLKLQDYLLYAHGPDLCHSRDLRHAMANCFEALMGALFLDGGIELADRVFSNVVFDEEDLSDTWLNIPKHPLQNDEPDGDRHWIKNSPTLQKLLAFEDDVGYEFRHIRLLAKSFTQRNIGYNHLTLGHNQRLEFLGDTIMKLIASDYLFRHFPDHHEGHLTLLRSSLVNNKTQSTVAEELGMPDFVINMQREQQLENTLKQKEKADLLEAFLGAIYVDGGLEPCYVLCNVCFFPRLEDFILNQEWNDPKSQLQQCCLTLREMNDESPDIPVYKVLSKAGPTNSCVFKVGVYFRGKRLAVGQGSSKQMGEMRAAENALNETKGLFHNRFWTMELDKRTKLVADLKASKSLQPKSYQSSSIQSTVKSEK